MRGIEKHTKYLRDFNITTRDKNIHSASVCRSRLAYSSTVCHTHSVQGICRVRLREWVWWRTEIERTYDSRLSCGKKAKRGEGPIDITTNTDV